MISVLYIWGSIMLLLTVAMLCKNDRYNSDVAAAVGFAGVILLVCGAIIELKATSG